MMHDKRDLRFTSKQSERGFTLVELLISTAIFSLFMIGIVGSFAAIMKIHEHSIGARNAQTNGRLALEDVARLIRNAGTACTSYDGDTCQKGEGSRLLLDKYTCISYNSYSDYDGCLAGPDNATGSQLAIYRQGQPIRTLTQDVQLSGLRFSVPGVSAPYVSYQFMVNTNVATGVGPEWQINSSGEGVLLGSTVTLRNRMGQ
jgi:prepilin-type N-terminal cleavage/methylation domain-containing protein